MWELRTGTRAWQSFYDSTAAINLWTGSVSAGKTVAANIRWLNYIANAPEGDLIMVGKTLDTLKRNILNPIYEATLGAFTYTLGQREAYFQGRKIYLVGANDERSENKIRGMTLAGAYGDELTLWPKSFWDMLHTRLRAPGARFFGTTNPDHPMHWLKAEVIDSPLLKPRDLAVFHFTMDDNTFLEPEYVERQKRLYTGFWFDRFILGKWVVASGLIYDMFRTDTMVCDCPFIPAAYYVGVDYGSQNATVFLLVATDYRRLHVMREYYYSGRDSMATKTNAEYTVDLADFCKGLSPSAVLIDPSAASFIEDVRRTGLPVRPADNSVLDGIRSTAAAFANNWLTISIGCVNLLREIQSYTWDTKAAEGGNERPIKNDDHALDALRYVVYTSRWER